MLKFNQYMTIIIHYFFSFCKKKIKLKQKTVKYLQKVYTINDIKEAKKNPAIVHYAGKMGKPWRMKKPYQDYQEYIDSLPKELRKYTFRDLRKRIFNKR